MEEKTTNTSTKRGHAISVIVPVYKVEPYLRCCIDSILAQTFTDFELILVDDGSPDTCGAICDEYAAKDDRIVVIHQENAGVSAARNAGLDWVFANSDSEWITFVDSDDAIVPVYLKQLHQYAVDHDADVVTTYGETILDAAGIEKAPQHVVSFQNVTGRDCCVSLYSDGELIGPYPWGKLYRKDLLKDSRFTIGITYAEDEEYVIKSFYSVSKVIALRAWLYCYRQRESSAVHRTFAQWMYDRLRVIDSCISFFEEQEDTELIRLAERRKVKYGAKYMLLAYGAGMKDSVPVQYKMPIWKAFLVTLMDTVRHGGVQYIVERIQKFGKRISG